MSKWWRVIDGASPFYGLDVCGKAKAFSMPGFASAIEIESVRRFDVFVGDRPMQISRVKGILISTEILEESPVQDDDVVMDSEPASPYGVCLEEVTLPLLKINSKNKNKSESYYVFYVLFERGMSLSLRKAIADKEETLASTGIVLGSFESSRIKTVQAFVDLDRLKEEIEDQSIFERFEGF